MAIFGTLIEVYPWLSVQEGPLLDPSNPYSEMFKLVNGGYIPVNVLGCGCIPSRAAFSNRLLVDNSQSSFKIMAVLAHDGWVTIPCFNTFDPQGNFSPSAGAKLEIEVVYTMFHYIRRTQAFHFKAVIGKGSQQYWQFLGS